MKVKVHLNKKFISKIIHLRNFNCNLIHNTKTVATIKQLTRNKNHPPNEPNILIHC